MSIVYKELINNTINKLNSSFIKPQRPYVAVNINGHRITALYDTGADVCCMSSKAFRKLYEAGNRPVKINKPSSVSAASGNKLNGEGIYAMLFTIDKRKFVFEVHVFTNLKEEMILGINFCQTHGLGYDPSTEGIYWTDSESSSWTAANLQSSEKITIQPTSNIVVTLNVISRKGYRVAEPSEAIAAISSETYVIQGGPALVKINRQGQTTMEIFNCSNNQITIEKGSVLGIIERLDDDDEVGELNVNEMTANIEKQQLPPSKVLTQEKKTYISENAKLNVPAEFKQKYMDLLMKHHEVISDNKYDLGKCTTAMHDIELRNEDPIYIKQFKIPEAQQEAVQKHVEELLKLGVVRPSRSRYNSPMFIVAKKDGGVRIVQDFRAVNQQTLVDKYSMRDVQECIDEIGRAGSTIFSTIDLTSGFWQMMLNPECRKYTAFTLPGIGQFEWNASPMGLLGAPGSFQRLMEIVIHNLSNILAYIDDLLVHTKDHNKHLEILDELFTRLRKHGLKINLPKSFFGAEEVSYLGFKLTPEGIKPGSGKLKAVAAAKPPNDIHEVRGFLGLCNFFRGHVRNFAQMTAPLNRLTTNDCEWKNGPLPADAEKAFKELKTILISEPVVHYPVPTLPYALITDATQSDSKSAGGYGAILVQIKSNGEFQVISYASRKLKCHEKNYAPFLQDLAASVWGMEHFSVYLKGKHFILYTDSKAQIDLSSVHTKTLNRLQAALKEYDFEIILRTSREMPAEFLGKDVVNLIKVNNSQMEKDQNQEEWIRQIKGWLLNGTSCSNPRARNAMTTYMKNKLFIEDNLLWIRITNRNEPSRSCLVLPDNRIHEALQDSHGAEHEGIVQTRLNLCQHYWWPGLDQDVGEFMKRCPNCSQKQKDFQTDPRLRTSWEKRPNQKITVDIIQAPTHSEYHNRYVMSMTDTFSTYVELTAVPDSEPVTVAHMIFANWICRYGVPIEFVFNQNQQFCDEVLEEIFHLLEIKENFPKCISQPEISNQNMANLLETIMSTARINWEGYLAPLMFSYNTSFNRKVQTSPFFMTFGQHANQPAFNDGDWKKKNVGETLAAQKYQMLQRSRQVAWEPSAQQRKMEQTYFDRQSAPHEFTKDQWVMMREKMSDRKPGKFSGPFQIIKLKPQNHVEIKIGPRNNLIVHVKTLKPFEDVSQFQTSKNKFQKQGGDSEDFEDFNSEEEKFENTDRRRNKRKTKRRPQRQTSEEDTDSEDGNSDRDRMRNQQPKFPNLEDLDKRYHLRKPTQDVGLQTDAETEAEAEAETEAERERDDSETDTASEGEENRREEVAENKWIVDKLKKHVNARVQNMKRNQSRNLINVEAIKLNLLSQIHPFITESRKIIKACPKALIKKTYPSWNENQIINYWWSGDIYEGPDMPNLISLADNPYLPTSIFGRLPAVPIAPPPLLINEGLFEDEDGLEEEQPRPGPALPTRPRPGRPKTSAGGTAKYELENVRADLRTATFAEASQYRDLNPDEQAFFRKAFYHSTNEGREVRQQLGRPSRANPGGLRTFLEKSKKK